MSQINVLQSASAETTNLKHLMCWCGVTEKLNKRLLLLDLNLRLSAQQSGGIVGNVGFVGGTMCEIKKTIYVWVFNLFVCNLDREPQSSSETMSGRVWVLGCPAVRSPEGPVGAQITHSSDKQRNPSLSGRKCSRIRKLEADRSENCEQFASQFKSGDTISEVPPFLHR